MRLAIGRGARARLDRRQPVGRAARSSTRTTSSWLRGHHARAKRGPRRRSPRSATRSAHGSRGCGGDDVLDPRAVLVPRADPGVLAASHHRPRDRSRRDRDAVTHIRASTGRRVPDPSSAEGRWSSRGSAEREVRESASSGAGSSRHRPHEPAPSRALAAPKTLLAGGNRQSALAEIYAIDLEAARAIVAALDEKPA